ncbi:MAG: glycosyltransferase family 39 protein [Victivallaceae bacterium]|nr:glycosyltransferase family 39 protein [Victivallaceae bacterium]
MSPVRKEKLLNLCVLIATMLGALALRLTYLALHPLETRDGIGYVRFIEKLHAEGAAAFPDLLQTQPPLFVWLSWKLTDCGLDAATAAVSVNIAAGVLLLIPVYFAGKRLFGEVKYGFMSSGIAAVMPLLVRFSCERLRESLYLLCAAIVLCCWLYAVTRVCAKRNFFFCGLFGVVAVFCRYEGLELLLLGAFALPSALLAKPRLKNFFFALLAFSVGVFVGYFVMRSLPGMPDIFVIFYNRVKIFCLVQQFKPF